MAHPVTALTVLSGEYAVDFRANDVLTFDAPGNFHPNEFAAAGWLKPNWASSDTDRRMLFYLTDPAGQNVIFCDWFNGKFRIVPKSQGAASVQGIEVTPSAFNAGDEVFLGIRITGGTAYISVDGGAEDSGALTDSLLNEGDWTFDFGRHPTLGLDLEGSLNLHLFNVADASIITDRFASGSGLAEDAWLESATSGGVMYGEALVLRLAADASGSAAEYRGFQGETFNYTKQADANSRWEADDPGVPQTTPIDVRWCEQVGEPGSSTGACVHFGQGGGYRVATFSSGVALRIYFSGGPGGGISANSGWSTGEFVAGRITFDPDRGDGQYEAKFYKRTPTLAGWRSEIREHTGWTLIATLNDTSPTMSSNTNPLTFIAGVGLTSKVDQREYGAVVLDGIEGTEVLAPHFDRLPPHTDSFVDQHGVEYNLLGTNCYIALDPDDTENDVANGGMEDWTTGTPDSWTDDGVSSVTEVTGDVEQGAEIDGASLSQSITTTNGGLTWARARVKDVSGASPRLGFAGTNVDGSAAVGTWETVGVLLRPDAASESLVLNGAGGVGTYDQIAVYELEALVPTADVTPNTNVSANTATLTLATQQATIVFDTVVDANTATLTLATFAADISLDTNVAANTATLTLATNAADIQFDVIVDAGTATLTLTTFAAAINALLLIDGTAISIRPVDGWSETWRPLFSEERLPGGLYRSAMSDERERNRVLRVVTPVRARATIQAWETVLRGAGVRTVTGGIVDNESPTMYVRGLARREAEVTGFASLTFTLEEG